MDSHQREGRAQAQSRPARQENPTRAMGEKAGPFRLQRVLAAAGIASRRAAEEMILAGRVSVNDRVVMVLGTKVDPARDRIAVDGKSLPSQGEPLRYVMLYKPQGYLSTLADPEGRPTLTDLVHVPERLYSVGRLDMYSEGLLLLTNDGELAHRLSHPRYEHPKEYLVLVEGKPTVQALAVLRAGVNIQGKETSPAQVEILTAAPTGLPPFPVRQDVPTSWLRFILHEGRKRQIRHMTAAVGYPTLRLVRVGLGPLRLGNLPPGQWRDLTAGELAQLRYLGAQPMPDTASGPSRAVTPRERQNHLRKTSGK